MNDFQSSLCDLLLNLTDIPVGALSEVRQGVYLSNIMHNIDPDFFALDNTLDDWHEAQFLIERFLASKGIQDKSVEFEINDILYGKLEQLVSAIFQLFALVALFNPPRWAKVVASADSKTMAVIKPILDPMVEEAAEKFNLTAAAFTPQEENDVTLMLRKLERYQSRIEEFELKIKDLKAEINTEKEENLRKQREIERQKMEIQQIKQLKEDMLYQLEFTIPKENQARETAQTTRIATLTAELTEALKRAAELGVDVDRAREEIQAHLLTIDSLRDRQRQFDEVMAQCNYYKNLSESLRVEREIGEAKIKGYEGIDKKLRETLDLLQQERNGANSLKLTNVSLQNKIESLLKRLNFAEEKAKMMRKQSISNVERYNEMVKQLSFIRELEEQNVRMRNVLCSLMRVRDMDGLHKLQQYVADERLVSTKSTWDCLGTNQSLVERNLENEDVCRSFADGHGAPTPPERNPRARLEAESVSDDSENEASNATLRMESSVLEALDHRQQTMQEIVEKRCDFSAHNIQILYSVFMESQAQSLGRGRSLVSARENRGREILKPFPMDNVMNQLNF